MSKTNKFGGLLVCLVSSLTSPEHIRNPTSLDFKNGGLPFIVSGWFCWFLALWGPPLVPPFVKYKINHPPHSVPPLLYITMGFNRPSRPPPPPCNSPLQTRKKCTFLNSKSNNSQSPSKTNHMYTL